MDNTLRVWDSRPFCTGERCVKVFTGHNHNFEKNLLHCAWSPDGALVAAGSSDRLTPSLGFLPCNGQSSVTGMSTSGTLTTARSSTNCRDTWAASTMLTSTRSSRSYSAQAQTSRFIWENSNLED